MFQKIAPARVSAESPRASINRRPDMRVNKSSQDSSPHPQPLGHPDEASDLVEQQDEVSPAVLCLNS